MTDKDAITGAPSRTRRLRPLGGLLAAMAVALTGTRVSAIALPWFVLVTTGSATQTGLVAFCEMTPYVVVKALTGPVVDRAGPRVVSWSTDAVSAAAAGAIPLLHAADLLSFPVLLALVAVIGAVRGPGDLAKHVMVPEAAERARVPLERATGLSGVTERLASTVGPAVGGLLVASLGPMTGLVLNAACFALGSLIISLALPRGMGHPADGAPPASGYWRRFGEGFAFLRGEPLLLTIIVMVGITNLLDAAFNTVLLPVWAERSGNGPTAIGLSNGVWSVTAVAGSLVAAAVAHRMPRRVVFFAGFLLAGAPRFLVLAADAPMWAVLGVFAVSGAGGGFLNPILGAITFERVPHGLRGRVNALGDAMAWAGIPLGGLIAGVAVAWSGLVPVLLTAGAAYFLTTNLAALLPQWREMDRLRGRGARESRAADPAPVGGDVL
ncbi:MFS transporter [Microbispora siamensis]